MLKYDVPNANLQNLFEQIINDYNHHNHVKLLNLEIKEGAKIDNYHYHDSIVYTIRFTGLGGIYLNNVDLIGLIENVGFEKPEVNCGEWEYYLCLDYAADYIYGLGYWYIRIYAKEDDLKYFEVIRADDWTLNLNPYVSYYNWRENDIEFSENCNFALNEFQIQLKDNNLKIKNLDHYDSECEYIREYKLPTQTD